MSTPAPEKLNQPPELNWTTYFRCWPLTCNHKKTPLFFVVLELIVFSPPLLLISCTDERYVHLDITAMETAQRVGAEHVQARENRLTELGGQARRAGALSLQRTTQWHFKKVFTSPSEYFKPFVTPICCTTDTPRVAKDYCTNNPFH